MDKRELFASRLKDLISEKEINLSVIEKAVGINHSTISRYLSAQRAPQLEQIWILADYFGCTVDYLLGRTDY